MPSTATASEVRSEPRTNSPAANDLWLEAFVVFNFLCLTGDITLAHSENHFRVRAEYLPLWFSLVAAVLLSVAFLARLRRNWQAAWTDLGHLVGWASIAVGTAGVVYHLDSQFFYQRTLKSLTYAAPFAAPAAPHRSWLPPGDESHGGAARKGVGPMGVVLCARRIRRQFCAQPDRPRRKRLFPLDGMDSGDQQRFRRGLSDGAALSGWCTRVFFGCALAFYCCRWSSASSVLRCT